ncbi:leucine-rich repeat-containing protein 17 [Eublepharis macularius]|uniref:Leucine-rich repeat-containing protein 17 n=1 Tax=Eublepharis macularius TaxID=481883 RepID=A0AA97JVN5_EUBMA|nr:leucine-rich repeat-containing protein 17 [Eublepharis macularius]XP_054844281.1 leucine-rich repeat-containing protein 17 [Eublepharis macularius]
MQVVTIILLLFFCKAADFRKTRNGSLRNRANNGRGNGLRKASSTVKRYTQGLPCDVYTYLYDKYLDCQERKLTFVLSDWPEDLKHMLLARNRIRKLKNNMFSKYKKLKTLDLQQNEITKIEDQAFFGLNKLTTLLLQHNQMKTLSEEVFIYMPLLSYLRLYDNPWHCNCQMESLITTLQLPRSRNLGNYAKCGHPTELQGQKLKQIKVETLCTLEERRDPSNLVVPKPEVTRPEFDSSLCHIYLFPVQTLDCRKKELKTVPGNIPPDVVKLDLSNNKIKQLRPKEFEDMNDLKVLNLSSNGIDHIDPAAFAGLINLEELDLSNNSLQNFEYGVLEDLYFLKILWLRENPWKCDYSIHYLFYWLKHHYSVHYSGLECRKPEEYKGWLVGKYVRSYYEECPKGRLSVYPETFEQDTDDEEWERLKDPQRTAKKHGVVVTVIG